MGVLRLTVQIIAQVLLPLAVQRWDYRRLRPEQRARAWNFASWACALYAFGPLSMLGWCWVTRRSARGVLLGVASAAVLVLMLAALDALISRLVEG